MSDPKPCARCKQAPRNSRHRSYCVDCLLAITRESAERVKQRPATTKLCARCEAAPRNSSLPSYCVDCKRELERESAERRGQWKTAQVTCSRCGGPRDGAHKSYCVVCFKEYKAERLLAPCGRCGAMRAEGDRTNSAYCYVCWRGWWLLRKYGLTGDQFDAILAGQGDRCAICRCEDNGRAWHVDHDHVTGRVRGILCDNCNRALGHFKDNVEALRRAVEYLEAQRT